MLICTMDRPELLQRCLDAIMSGTALPSTILVVDQSRQDDRTADVTASIAARVATAGCSVHHLRSSGGMARGQNEGLHRISEDIVLVTDDDCVPDPSWVEEATRTMAADPALGLLGGFVDPLPVDDEASYAVASRTSTEAVDLDRSSDPWRLGSGNNFVVRRHAALSVGGNDERLGPGARFGGGADLDLFRRMMRSDVRARYEPRVVVRHARATAAEHRARRFPYGYGMGLAWVLWWRQGDRDAPRIAGRYLVMRLRRVRAAARRRDRRSIHDEAILLWGFLRGTLRGAILSPSPEQHEPVA